MYTGGYSMRKKGILTVCYIAYCAACLGGYLYLAFVAHRPVIIGSLLIILAIHFFEFAHSGHLNGGWLSRHEAMVSDAVPPIRNSFRFKLVGMLAWPHMIYVIIFLLH